MAILSVPALAVLEHASDAVFVTSDRFVIEWVNEAATAMLGYPRDQLVGRNIAELVIAEDLAATPLRGKELRAGARLVTERSMRRGDGSVIRIEVSSCRLPDGRLLGLTRDVTVRAEAAARLRQSEESFRTLAEKLPDAIAIHRDGLFVFCNSALVETLGYTSANELLGIPILEVVHPESRPVAATRLAALAQGTSEVPWIEERILRRDGSSLIMEIGAVVSMFEGAPAVVVVGRDVTERKALQLRLAEADRMASLGTLAAGMAHEINNPLTYVYLNLDSAMRALADIVERGSNIHSATAVELLEKINAAIDGAKRVGDIVTGMRRFARAEDASRGPVDVGRAIDAAVRLIDHERRVRARLLRDVKPTRPVQANEGRLTQVFVNLLANAVHAIPEGRADDHVIAIRSWDEGDTVRITISDTGIGIPQELLRRVFDPFFTTKDPGAGVGLGLAICHGIVTGYGGTIEVASTVGRGTTFTVTLPASAAAISAAEPSSAASTRSRRHRVLVIDDEEMIRRATAEALRDHYEVKQIASGREAIARFSDGDEFDAIVCDLTMPDISGADLHRWLEEHRPELAERMIFTSGGNHELAARFPGRWLDKPFSVSSLRKIIDALVDATRGHPTGTG